MTPWIANFTVCAVFLYNLLLGNNYLGLSHSIASDVLQPNAASLVEKSFSAENLAKDNENKDYQRFFKIIKDAEKLDGLFAVYRRSSDGRIYLEIKPEQLNKNYLATVTIESGIGENGIYSGLALQDFLFYFRRVNSHSQSLIAIFSLLRYKETRFLEESGFLRRNIKSRCITFHYRIVK